MPIRKIFFLFVGIWCLLCLCLRCGMNLSNLQDARTLGQGNVSTGVSYNWSKMPILFDFNDNQVYFEDAIDNIRNVAVNVQYGASKRLDLGFQFGVPTTVIGLSGKYLLTKKNHSLFALSIGASAGINTGNFLQLPVYFSIHPSENISIYCNPQIIWQEGSYFFSHKTINIKGFNSGILMGSKRFKFGIDGGYFIGKAGKYDFNLFTVGIGLKYNFLKRK